MLEIESLKLDLFDARLPELDEVMRDFNYSTVMCNCSNCHYRQRTIQPSINMNTQNDIECSFVPAWNYHLKKLKVPVFSVDWNSFAENIDDFICSKYSNIPFPFVMWSIASTQPGRNEPLNNWLNYGWGKPILSMKDVRLPKMQLVLQWPYWTPEQQIAQAYDPVELDRFLPMAVAETVVGI